MFKTLKTQMMNNSQKESFHEVSKNWRMIKVLYLRKSSILFCSKQQFAMELKPEFHTMLSGPYEEQEVTNIEKTWKNVLGSWFHVEN